MSKAAPADHSDNMSERHYRSLARIEPRPKTIYCSQGRVVLATDLDGLIGTFPRHGLFAYETRVLSRYRYYVDGDEPQRVVVSNVEQHSWLGYYITRQPGLKWQEDTGSGEMEPQSEETLELKVCRTVGLGVHEDIDFTNFTQVEISFPFEIELDADFSDQAETFQRKQQGKLTRHWQKLSARRAELSYDYRAMHHYSHQGNTGTARIHRGLVVSIENADSRVQYRVSKLKFQIRLKRGKSWHTCVKFIAILEEKTLRPLYRCRQFFGIRNELDRKRHIFLNESTDFHTRSEPKLAGVVESALLQAKHDLADLRLPDLDHGDRAWVMAAGLPIYIALFGRDTLTAGWQAALTSTQMMQGALYEMPKWQGRVENDWRDEQPGRMLHEAHTGPLATLGYNPRTRYYGATTTSSFFPVVAAELWHWTGDKSLVKPLIAPALRALRWKDEYADLRGDGFSYYKTRSRQGNKNQAWKDSGDAIVYEDGREVETPIATCEEQAYVYVSKMHMAELLLFMGEIGQARKLFHEAGDLKERFNEKFWMKKEQYFVFGLDSGGRPIRPFASTPGHSWPAGLVDRDHVLP